MCNTINVRGKACNKNPNFYMLCFICRGLMVQIKFEKFEPSAFRNTFYSNDMR